MDDRLKITRRRLPHWQLRGSTYYITFRVAGGILSPDEIQIVLSHIGSGDGKFYRLIAAIVMPDHTHAILRPVDAIDLTRIMKGIKGVTARLINQQRDTTALSLWQDDSWDRILRDHDELTEKLNFMLNNPAEASLVENG
jgi:hypothetical protein